MRKIKKILIANRGEIAVRIIKTCREMGITSVAVFSEADKKALHVKLADEAYSIGPSPPLESYLNIDKIISVAKKCKANAIHPGYGFLAENSLFVKRCEEEGIIFIGPPSEPMEIMGKKTLSRKRMIEAGVPIIPGTIDSIKDEKDLFKTAKQIGFPLLLKASAGGGGKGMRLVKNEDELLSSYQLAKSEAHSSFGDDSIYIEKYIDRPHHIEIQILADQYGNYIYLGERECSIQRRYQKVLEETPSPLLDDNTRRAMGEVAVKAAKAVGYVNAGTVEFVVDENKNFYFLEMNTRLQVEHPITEMVTGIDLVKEQIKIASGEKLSFNQKDIKPRGASIECRIYAEDPDNNFLPSTGTIVYYQAPEGGLGIRLDSGVYQGYQVPMEYDPIIAKLITWGRTREEAIHRMLRALFEYQIIGIKTTIPFFKKILLHPKFYSGKYNTHFINELEKMREEDEEEKKIALIAAGIKNYLERKSSLQTEKKTVGSNWKFYGRLKNFSNRF
ncbi:acetyl-CoA carboxylase biotin carboxylase subunit [Candidatus Aminicenantes bacterium AH-873-B07]|jgi:acetyl-CoA carboxylase biotin carboxylase subunit|nr:acetyl-CoA carboxylase biotin carboxylase subunit [Candidatus Aminicenantes bacterium AH-873-B07]